MEKKYTELERKVELVFLDQKFHEEIIEDFIEFKKYAEISMDIGGYYDPCKTYNKLKFINTTYQLIYDLY